MLVIDQCLERSSLTLSFILQTILMIIGTVVWYIYDGNINMQYLSHAHTPICSYSIYSCHCILVSMAPIHSGAYN